MTSIEVMKDAADRMDRARAILTDNNPHPECNWGMLDTTALRAAIEAQENAQPVACGYDETTGICTNNPCCYPAPSAPPGYVLVPVEPTFEMLQSADDMHDDVHISRGRAYDAWGRMLAAAPKVSSVPLLTHLEIEKLFYSEQKNKWWKVDFNSFVSISRAIERRIRGETT